MEDIVYLRGGLAGFKVDITHTSGDLLPTLLRMDDVVSFLADYMLSAMGAPTDPFDKKEISSFVSPISEEYGLDKKGTKALETIARVYGVRRLVEKEADIFYTEFRPERGNAPALHFVAKWGKWIAVKKVSEDVAPVDKLFFLSSLEETLRRKIRELASFPSVLKRRASKKALQEILSSLPPSRPERDFYLRAALDASNLPLEYGAAYEFIRPRKRVR